MSRVNVAATDPRRQRQFQCVNSGYSRRLATSMITQATQGAVAVRWTLPRWLLAAALGLMLAGAPEVGNATRLGSDFCESGEVPTLHFGFQNLASVLGDTMGAPIECEHPDSASGDTLSSHDHWAGLLPR